MRGSALTGYDERKAPVMWEFPLSHGAYSKGKSRLLSKAGVFRVATKGISVLWTPLRYVVSDAKSRGVLLQIQIPNLLQGRGIRRHRNSPGSIRLDVRKSAGTVAHLCLVGAIPPVNCSW